MKKIFLFLALISTITSIAQQKGGMSPKQIAERNKPGTVMILATFKGTVKSAKPYVDEAALGKLALQIKQQLEAAGNFSTELFWTTYIKAFSEHVDQYMYKSDEIMSEELNTTMLGSGFVITPDGYVVTNAHVIDASDESTKQSFAQQAFAKIINQDIADIETSMGRKATDEEVKSLTDAESWYFSQTLTVDEIKTEYSVILGVTGKDGAIVPMTVPAQVVTRGEPIPGKDVAILKLQDKHTYPTIRIGDDTQMSTGDPVYVLGYPGVATFHPLISEESMTEATLTTGLVSARKKMKGGWDVLQIDAAITHGNSGGPVMNDKGEVIGLATFGSADEQRGQEVQGMNFIVPATIVKEFLEKGNVKPAMSDISLAYEAAMNLFDKSSFKKALKKFQEVKEMNPSFPFIDKYIKDTQTNIDKGLDKGGDGIDTLYYYIGGGAVALIALIAIMMKRKKKTA
ncbi:MAG: trypsin-like peptidase domain-containing protein [Bacteroidetes bacterium]|nr:trypsin-like peptidase domain-containing protein [Bacteroidota bacterium]